MGCCPGKRDHPQPVGSVSSLCSGFLVLVAAQVRETTPGYCLTVTEIYPVYLDYLPKYSKKPISTLKAPSYSLMVTPHAPDHPLTYSDVTWWPYIPTDIPWCVKMPFFKAKNICRKKCDIIQREKTFMLISYMLLCLFSVYLFVYLINNSFFVEIFHQFTFFLNKIIIADLNST